MATQFVPYHTAMQLGSGFNSYTQTLCIDHAVTRDADPLAEEKKKIEVEPIEVAQSVTYKTSVIEKTSDVTDMMKINGAFNIKYDQLQVNGTADFVNTNKIKESDVTIMVSVKVVNQVIYDHSLTKFQPITNIKDVSQQRLVEVYGDSFISGWQEGGEFLAVISIKAKNRDEAQTMALDAKVAYTRNKDATAPEANQKELDMKLDAKFDKVKKNIAAENEVSISVTWIGGGQHLKDPKQDWDFDTMKAVALKFPDLCAKTPMRTHALLTKYSALRSFVASQSFDLPLYDKTGTYTNILQEAYLDYKSILSGIQVLTFDVCEGIKALVVNPRTAKALEQAKPKTSKGSEVEPATPAKDTPASTDTESVEGVIVDVKGPTAPQSPKLIMAPPPTLTEAFPPTIEGLEEARMQCRFMMNRIVQEIDNITIKPEIATDETHQSPYLSPFLFKMLLPLGVAVSAESSPAAQAVAASKIDPDALADKFGGGPNKVMS